MDPYVKERVIVNHKFAWGWAVLAVVAMLAFGWCFRYAPDAGERVVWDRLTHRYCTSWIGEPVRCYKGRPDRDTVP